MDPVFLVLAVIFNIIETHPHRHPHPQHGHSWTVLFYLSSVTFPAASFWQDSADL